MVTSSSLQTILSGLGIMSIAEFLVCLIVIVIFILCKTSYHYWRFGVSDILRDTGAKFKKDERGRSGIILVGWRELDNSRKILLDYKLQNLDTKEMWW